MKKLSRIFFVITFCFYAGNLFSQQKNTTENTKSIAGKNFVIHKVEKGETIYSLSKKYEVKESQLLEWNPELSSGLKLGSEIKILKNEKKSISVNEDRSKVKGNKINQEKESKNSDQEQPKELPEFHLVEPGQTLYTISKLYGISIDEINQKNPEVLENGLKAGKTISIRNKAKVIKENVLQSTLKSDTTNHKENVISAPKETISNDNNNSMPLKKYELSVALLAPFYTDKNVYEEEVEEGSEEEKQKKLLKKFLGNHTMP